MTEAPESRLYEELTQQQAASVTARVPEFVALTDISSYLGFKAHVRLEELLGMPVASDDAQPMTANPEIGQRSGVELGELVGRQTDFTRNLPKIQANMKQVAEERGISEAVLWDGINKILLGSGICGPMHRTLDRPVGGSYGAHDFIEEHSDSGIVLIVRENIANWGARRHEKLQAQLGSMSQKTLRQVGLIVYAGSGRQYKGPNEVWRPEVQPYITQHEDGSKSCSLTEATAASKLHAPDTRNLLGQLGLRRNVSVRSVSVNNPKASGDDVMRGIMAQHGDRMKDMLVVEFGNAPAGYTQLAGALVLAKELGIDPTRQYLAITDNVNMVHPDSFQARSIEERSKVQNAVTALNTLNGWLQTIVRVNQYMLAQS